MLFCAFVCTAWAGPTDLPEMSEEGNIKWYTIKNVRRSKYATYAGESTSMSQQTTTSAASCFYFTGTITDGVATVKIHNYAAGEKLCAGTNSWTEAGIDWYIAAKAENGLSISKTSDFSGTQSWNDFQGGGQLVDYWTATDAGSIWEITLVADPSTVIDIPGAKTAAITELENLKKIDLFSADAATIDAAISEIEGVGATENSLAALDEAYNTVNNLKAEAYGQIYNKNIRLTSYGRNTTDGHDLAIDANGALGITNSGDAGIWTMQSKGDGTFALYNFASNLYLGPTVGQSSRVPAKTTLAEAGRCSFNLYNEDTQIVNIISNGQPLHVAGGATIVQWYDNDGASNQWKIEECANIVVSREVYDAAAASAQVLSSAIYQAYGDLGLVNDTTQLSSNAKEANEGSFKGLVDGDYATFFHSSWSAAIGDYHYLQVAVEEGIEDFFFYFKKRQQNNNNRPTEIDILGSVDGTEFSLIKTVSGCMPTDANCTDYVSQLVDGTAPVKHLRFVVKATSNGALDGTEGHPFFTFSEFDILPANDDIKTLVDAYHNFAASSITSDAMAAAATALVNAETTLSLANIKKEVAAILAANASKHAETPALGQYPTATYNALNAAYTAADATQESIEAAIAAFNNSKNRPVFTISSPKDYVVGKSIYDNNSGTLYFKATNNYDKSMWWAFDQTETTVGVTEKVVVTNIATGNKFWGANSVKITETSDANAEDGIFLLYTEGNGTPVHYQNDGQKIVRWNSTDAASGSAMTFTYVGNTYDLENLTEEHIAALVALQTAATANAKYLTAEVGTALGQYAAGDKEAFLLAFADAQIIADMSVTEVTEVSPSDILGVAEAITNSAATFVGLNMPTTGFYRVKSMNGNDENKKGKYWQSNAAGTGMELAAEKNDVRSVIYLDSLNNVISYGSGFALNSYSDFNDIAPKAWTIAENAKVAGAYALFRNGDTYCLSDWTGGVTYGQNDANAAWALEEVTALPVSIADTLGYATLYAPVALTIPAEVTAYTGYVEGDVLKLTAIEWGIIPAKTAVLIQAAAGTYNFEIIEDDVVLEGDAVAVIKGNDLIGISVGEASVEGVFTLQNINGVVGFHKYTAENLHGFKAFLIPETAQTVKLGFAGTTAIENITTAFDVNAPIYDLAGRRVNAATKGIFIQNGKKIIVK